MKVFISGIGTDVGKSVVSAAIIEATGADYWKPVQTGDKDTDFVSSLITRPFHLHNAIYTFKKPASPHVAATLENTVIQPEKIILPETHNHLVIEGAGGLMVPLNNNFLVIDLIQQLNVPVVLVSKHYLGSINHTLLSIEALRKRNINLLGIVFNGSHNEATEKAILHFGNTQKLASINEETQINKTVIAKYNLLFKDFFNRLE